MSTVMYVPITPSDTPCQWLSGKTEQEAKDNLMKESAHMPYKTWSDFERGGYTIEEWIVDDSPEPDIFSL